MTRLVKKSATFHWGTDQHATFVVLRQKLCETQVLTLLEGVEDFMVY